jgi:hypothetical protein
MAGLFGQDERGQTPQEAFDAALVDAYLKVGRTLDDLAYTDEFERVFEMLAGDAASPRPDRAAVMRRLQNLRKANKLPRLGRAVSAAVKVTAEEERTLAELVVGACGTIGQRDQLLYDKRFDEIVNAFNARTGRQLTPHDAWRLVAKIAK